MIHIEKSVGTVWLDSAEQKHKDYFTMKQDEKNKEINNNGWRELRKHLVDEQAKLCGYCCAEITVDKSHIEHLKCKDIHKDLSLDYHNLIASCNTDSTCGNAKKNDDSDIVFPTDDDCEQQFEFNYFDGRIIGLTDKAERTIKILNLNSYGLKEARKAILKQACYYPSDGVKSLFVENAYNFCDIVRYAWRQNSIKWNDFSRLINGLGVS